MAYNQYNQGGRPPQGGRQSQLQYAPQPQYGGRAQPQGYGGSAQKSGTSSVFWIILCIVVVVMLGVGLLVGFFLGRAIGNSTGSGANLAVPNISLSGDILSWDEIPNATGYKIKKDGSPFETLKSATETSYDLSKLNLPEGTYRFAVASMGNGDSIADSLYSKEVTYEKRDEGTHENQLTKPTNLSVSDNKVLGWNAVNNADSYNIQISGQSDKTSNTASLDISYLPAEQDFVIKIQAVPNDSKYQASNWSDPYNYTTKQGALSAPVITLSTTQVSWNAIPNATGYVVSIDGSEKTTTATNYDLSNLADGKTYQIKVKATKGSVESSWSNTVSYTPEPPKVHVQVSFDANGGSNLSQTSKQVTLGETYGVLPTVTPPSDLSFVGWFDDKTGGNKVTSATKVTNQNAHTLYARFGEKVVGDTSPDAVEARLRNYMPQDLYETFFPERYGKFSSWHESEEDYYSYDQLIKGVRELANLKLRNIRDNNNLGDVGKVFITDKSTGVETMVFESVDFNANSTALFETIVDYGSFMADGDENTQKRDLAGFLGQISHETNRFGTSSNTREGALGFQQELNHSDTAGTEYTTQDQYPGSNTYNPTACKNFPPNLNKSYHGRGPMQLSWNYNYGLFSAMFFGDKMVLLDDPGMLARDGNGDLALAASLWFWMTPQGLKPSCHDVITGVYQPTAEDIADGRTADKIGFGWTIIIVNGYYEAETSRDGSVTSPNGNYSGQMDDRIQFYEFFTGNAWKPTGGIPGVTTTGLEADIDGEQLDTVGMKAYAW